MSSKLAKLPSAKRKRRNDHDEENDYLNEGRSHFFQQDDDSEAADRDMLDPMDETTRMGGSDCNNNNNKPQEKLDHMDETTRRGGSDCNNNKKPQQKFKIAGASASSSTTATVADATAISIATVRSALQTPKEEDRRPTAPFIVNGLDITQKHALWKDESRIIAPYNRNSAWWLAYHQGMTLDGETLKAIGVCNICGAVLQLGARSGTSSLTRHLASKHPAAHKAILDALKEGLVLGKYYEQPNSGGAYGAGSTDKKKGKVASGQQQQQQPVVITHSNNNEEMDVTKRPKQAPATTARIQKEAAASAVAAKCLDAHVIYAADRNRPFAEFDHPSFFALRQMIAQTALACARTKPSATSGVFEDLYQLDSRSVQNRANAMVNEIQSKVEKMIDHHNAPIVGFLHHWRGRAHEQEQKQEGSKSYQSFGIHWIQDFKRMSCVIAVDTNAEASALSWTDCEAKLKAWKMGSGSSHEKSLSFIVTDDSDSINNADNIDGKYIECLDHKLRRVADVAFKAFLGGEEEASSHDHNVDKPPGAEALSVARQICLYFDQNEFHEDDLKAKYKKTDKKNAPLGIIRDVGTQWWSTLAMIECLLEYREALSLYVTDTEFVSESPPFRVLSDVEWNTLQCIAAALKPVAGAIKILEGNNSVTSSLIACLLYEIREQLQTVRKQESQGFADIIPLSTVAGQMLEKLNEIMGDFTSDPFGEAMTTEENRSPSNGPCHGLDQALIFAHALDPRFKKLKLFDKNVRETIWTRLLAEMVKLRPSSAGDGPMEGDNATGASKEAWPSLGAYAALDNSDSGDDDDESAQDTWKASCEVRSVSCAFLLPIGHKQDFLVTISRLCHGPPCLLLRFSTSHSTLLSHSLLLFDCSLSWLCVGTSLFTLLPLFLFACIRLNCPVSSWRRESSLMQRVNQILWNGGQSGFGDSLLSGSFVKYTSPFQPQPRPARGHSVSMEI